MQQLLLPSPHIVQTELECRLDNLELEEAWELLQLLAGLQPLSGAQAQLQETLQRLIDRVGVVFPLSHRQPLRLLEAWQQAQADWPPPPYPELLEKFARRIFARLGQILARRPASSTWDEHPAGWYLARGMQLAPAATTLEARLQADPLDVESRRLLAWIHTEQQSHTAAAQHWLALLLQAPLEAPRVWETHSLDLPSGCLADPLSLLAHQPLPLLEQLHAPVVEEKLPGDPRLWWAVVGLWSGLFAWDQLPGAPIWDGVGTPRGVGGIPGAVLSFLAMQGKGRKTPAQKWQGAEAQRQLQRLAPSLYQRYKNR